MRNRSRTAQPQAPRTGYCLWVSLGLVVALFMTLASATAQACPKGAADGTTRSVSIADEAKIAQNKVVHKAKLKAVPASKFADAAGGVHCCTGCSGGIGCAGGCSAGCSAALDMGGASIDRQDFAGSYVFSAQREIFSVGPPPDSPPPRLFA